MQEITDTCNLTNRAVTLGGGVTKKENKRKKMLILYMSIYFQQITKCITTMEALKHSSKTASYAQSYWFNQTYICNA